MISLPQPLLRTGARPALAALLFAAAGALAAGQRPRRLTRPQRVHPRRPGVPDRRGVVARVRSLRRDAQVPARLQGIRLGQSGRPQGRHALPGQPRPAHELRQVQSVHAEGQLADRRVDPDVRAARGALGRRARHDLRPRRGGNAGRAGQVVDHVPRPSEGALLQRRPGDGGRRQALVRHADQQGRGPGGARRARRRQGRRRCWTSGRSASTSRIGPTTRIFNVAGLPVFSRKWGAGRRRQAEAVRRGRHRVPDHDGPVHDREHRLRPRHRVRAQSRLLGARPRRPARPVQFRPGRLSAVPPTARSAWRRSRPASST